MTQTLAPGFDTVQRTALLGVQFRDAGSLQLVSEGLRAEVQDLLQPRWRRMLTPNRSGVHVLHTFPGLPAFNGNPLTSPPAGAHHRLEVQDLLGRYLPAVVDLALPHEGLFGLPGAQVSPADTAPHVPLYSAATRSVPPPLACLRAELRHAAAPGRPVPWAVLELRLAGELLAQGLADEAGRALLIFPLPRPREAGLRDSPRTAGHTNGWDVSLSARWSRRRGPAGATGGVPELQTLLAQPAVGLLGQLSPRLPLAPLRLHAGEPLVAASAGSSFLYIAD